MPEPVQPDRCATCGQPPKPEMVRDHPVWPWFAVRIGPGGAWCHHYCSEACHAYADSYSAACWRLYHMGVLRAA